MPLGRGSFCTSMWVRVEQGKKGKPVMVTIKDDAGASGSQDRKGKPSLALMLLLFQQAATRKYVLGPASIVSRFPFHLSLFPQPDLKALVGFVDCNSLLLKGAVLSGLPSD